MDKPPRRTIEKPKPGQFGLSDILEAGAILVARNLLVLLRITAPLVIPVNAAFVALVLAIGIHSRSQATNSLFIGASVALGLVYLFALIFAMAGCLKAAADASQGERPSARSSLSYVLGRLRSLLWLVLALIAGIAPGIVLFSLSRSLGRIAPLTLLPFVLSLWLAGIWSVALPVLLTENAPVIETLKRSRALVRGRFLPSLGTVIFGLILAIFAGILAELLVSVFTTGGNEARLVFIVAGETFGWLLTVPLLAAYLTLLYFDLRARKEAIRSKKTE